MDSASFGRVKAVFVEAIELDETEREGYLAAACGADDGLRDEVKAWLAAARQTVALEGGQGERNSILTSEMSTPDGVLAVTEGPGSRIAR